MSFVARTTAGVGAIRALPCGPQNCLRVFYEEHASEQAITILTIGVKEGHRLFISGEEFEL